MSNSIRFEVVNDINKIVTFLSKRDINELSTEALIDKFGIAQVDMIIILGNSIPYTAELGAKAYKHKLAKDRPAFSHVTHGRATMHRRRRRSRCSARSDFG